MSVLIVPKDKQAFGQFNGGAILENKPIGFSHEGGELHAYSNLFYWAHAWSDNGSTIGLHPHKGFEIMSFVLKGQIEHYDTKLREWKLLSAGDAQIIRSGSGISHAEKLLAGSHIFQIWTDPDLTKTFQKEASYDDYENDSFPRTEEGGLTKKVVIGDGSPLTLDTANLQIEEYQLVAGSHKLSITDGQVASIYVIEGALSHEDKEILQDDFIKVEDESSFELEVSEDATLFAIFSPKRPAYRTYKEMQFA